METDMGKKNKSRSVELNVAPVDDYALAWERKDGSRFRAELIIGEDLYLYLTAEEYRSLESQIIDKIEEA
jgi:hypothetical protein